MEKGAERPLAPCSGSCSWHLKPLPLRTLSIHIRHPGPPVGQGSPYCPYFQRWKLRHEWLGDRADSKPGHGWTRPDIISRREHMFCPYPHLQLCLSQCHMLRALSLGSGRGNGQARPLQQCEADPGHPEAPQRRQQPHSSSVCHGLAPQVSTCRRLGAVGPAGSTWC